MPALRSRPRIPPQYQQVSDAFCFLSLSRAIGFGSLGAIPLLEIVTYHAIFPSGLSRPDFVEVIRLIDAEYLKTINKPDHDGSGPNSRSSNRPNRR